MSAVLLDWCGPFHFSDLAKEELWTKFDCPGLYAWREPDSIDSGSSGMKLYYIGKASGAPSLVMRQLQHYHAYIGGSYDIPEWARPGAGAAWTCGVRPPALLETLFDRHALLELVSDALAYALTLEIYFAPLDHKALKAIEHTLIWELQPAGNTHGVHTRPATLVNVTHRNAPWLSPR